jgi:basic membrane protein A
MLVLTTVMAAALLTISAGGAASTSSPAAPAVASRVALVLPGKPQYNLDLNTAYYATLQEEAYAPGLKVRIFVSPEGDLDRADKVATRLRRDGYGLVLWVGDGESAHRILPTVRQLTETRFVFLDASASTLGLTGISNASTVRFAHEQSAELVGYLSGLIPPRRGASDQRIDTIAYLGGRDTAAARLAAAGLERGLRRARQGGAVLVGFSDELNDRTACEALANDQIDQGAQIVVVADAGSCGLGALAVAQTRGVWAVADGSEGTWGPDAWKPQILARLVHNPQLAIQRTIDAYLGGALPEGRQQSLGLAEDYSVLVENVNPAVSQAAWSKVVDLCSEVRQHASKAGSQLAFAESADPNTN